MDVEEQTRTHGSRGMNPAVRGSPNARTIRLRLDAPPCQGIHKAAGRSVSVGHDHLGLLLSDTTRLSGARACRAVPHSAGGHHPISRQVRSRGPRGLARRKNIRPQKLECESPPLWPPTTAGKCRESPQRPHPLPLAPLLIVEERLRDLIQEIEGRWPRGTASAMTSWRRGCVNRGTIPTVGWPF